MNIDREGKINQAAMCGVEGNSFLANRFIEYDSLVHHLIGEIRHLETQRLFTTKNCTCQLCERQLTTEEIEHVSNRLLIEITSQKERLMVSDAVSTHKALMGRLGAAVNLLRNQTEQAVDLISGRIKALNLQRARAGSEYQCVLCGRSFDKNSLGVLYQRMDKQIEQLLASKQSCGLLAMQRKAVSTFMPN